MRNVIFFLGNNNNKNETYKDQIFTVLISLNSWSIRSTPLFGKASKRTMAEEMMAQIKQMEKNQ